MKILKHPLLYCAIFVLLVGASAGCSKKEQQTKETSNKENSGDLTAKGKELFYAPSNVNGIKCADCHSDGTNNANLLTKYFSDVKSANKRPSTYHGLFKGEEVAKNAGGATRCWQTFMRHKDDPMTAEQVSALNAYFESLKGTGEEIKYETLALPEPDKEKLKPVQDAILQMKPDLANGEKKFNDACAFCHGDKSEIKKVPKLIDGDFDGNEKGIVFKSRLGGKTMPFFIDTKLTDQEVADIAAFIMSKNK